VRGRVRRPRRRLRGQRRGSEDEGGVRRRGGSHRPSRRLRSFCPRLMNRSLHFFSKDLESLFINVTVVQFLQLALFAAVYLLLVQKSGLFKKISS
jgi:hypothetical protein